MNVIIHNVNLYTSLTYFVGTERASAQSLLNRFHRWPSEPRPLFRGLHREERGRQ